MQVVLSGWKWSKCMVKIWTTYHYCYAMNTADFFIKTNVFLWLFEVISYLLHSFSFEFIITHLPQEGAKVCIKTTAFTRKAYTSPFPNYSHLSLSPGAYHGSASVKCFLDWTGNSQCHNLQSLLDSCIMTVGQRSKANTAVLTDRKMQAVKNSVWKQTLGLQLPACVNRYPKI